MGKTMLISMRVEDTPQHNNQQSSVPSARRFRVSVPTPHETSFRVGLIGLSGVMDKINGFLADMLSNGQN